MQREVIGYSKMAQELIEQQLTTSPFFFASPSNTLFGVGVAQEFHQPIPFTDLARQATTMLQAAKKDETDNPVLFGIVPFSDDNPTRFVIPEKLYVSSSTRGSLSRPNMVSQAKLISSPSGQQYRQGVEDLLEMFATTGLSKAVLSRAVEVATHEDIPLQNLLNNLLAINSRGYTFAANTQAGTKLMGASPELLVAKKGSHLVSNPLAGSRPRSESEALNDASRLSLLNTQKDLHEHGLVVEEVERVLSRYCHNLYTPMVPSVIETQTMLHLSTVLEGQVTDPHLNVLQIAADLHPTPAVCGYPREDAYQAIRKIEQFDRGYFTGMVGWCDARGNGEWVVTIRCAEVQKRQMKVYAGAGIVNESVPQSELDETGAKMGTILSAAGIQLNDQLTA
ncbi:isochorismate synthase [Photobacterium sp. MCCC 1A19761]|uniref:isochorismate synthase n=1 Tax=Photobacterium sp. MCCC 1A19761 TaxID=3115000 RepID=UPI00307D5DE7